MRCSVQKLNKIKIPTSIGELIDKITILEIKLERIDDPNKLINIENELDALESIHIPHLGGFDDLMRDLKIVNEKLWVIEDAIRRKESKKEFDKEFIDLARSVYLTNDERSKIKRKINELTGSSLIEEKSYDEYA